MITHGACFPLDSQRLLYLSVQYLYNYKLWYHNIKLPVSYISQKRFREESPQTHNLPMKCQMLPIEYRHLSWEHPHYRNGFGNSVYPSSCARSCWRALRFHSEEPQETPTANIMHYFHFTIYFMEGHSHQCWSNPFHLCNKVSFHVCWALHFSSVSRLESGIWRGWIFTRQGCWDSLAGLSVIVSVWWEEITDSRKVV